MELYYGGRTHRIGAGPKVVRSLGAIHTPKVLVQSGIGDQSCVCQLRNCGRLNPLTGLMLRLK
jgi:hypothetical protein